jgi:hypothetical protein
MSFIILPITSEIGVAVGSSPDTIGHVPSGTAPPRVASSSAGSFQPGGALNGVTHTSPYVVCLTVTSAVSDGTHDNKANISVTEVGSAMKREPERPLRHHAHEAVVLVGATMARSSTCPECARVLCSLFSLSHPLSRRKLSVVMCHVDITACLMSTSRS